MTVRKATLKDIFDITVLLREFTREACEHNMSRVKFDPEHVKLFIEACINVDNSEVFVFENSDQEIHGLMICAVSPSLLSDELAAFEVFWYCDQKYRGSPAGIRLYKAYEEWAKAKGATTLNVSRIHGIEDDRMENLYSKLNLRKREIAYAKEI